MEAPKTVTTPYHKVIREIVECIPPQYWGCFSENTRRAIHGMAEEIKNEKR